MADVTEALSSARSAINDLAAAGERAPSNWTTPRAPGKWSPSQVVEHVALALDESVHVVLGHPSKFPTLPGLVRPAIRGLFFNRIVRGARFPKAKTSQAFTPASGPATAAAGRARLESAFSAFEAACRTQAAAGQKAESTIFGPVSVADYATFQERHIRHHIKQMA